MSLRAEIQMYVDEKSKVLREELQEDADRLGSSFDALKQELTQLRDAQAKLNRQQAMVSDAINKLNKKLEVEVESEDESLRDYVDEQVSDAKQKAMMMVVAAMALLIAGAFALRAFA